ncbi:MAG: hypothetical protein MUF65_03665 [Rubritepida sp.]|jgi:hypothetical protein|nr:hypothetical protein [Rubritepida sp.]MCU0944452.1 hypothetical protein [Rubritepida sp.]
MDGSGARRNCIFVSAGLRNNIDQWLPPAGRSWDLICVYYGDDPAAAEALRAKSDHFLQRKGSKWQNLAAMHRDDPAILQRYEFVWAMDDDIIVGPEDIERLFDLARRWDFWVCQPAFSPQGKVSHPITARDPSSLLRIVNFVENTCPLFRRDKLEAFLAEYDGLLAGTGTDNWYAHVLRSDLNRKFAIVDAVEVLNPTDAMKGGIREINTLQARAERRRHWRQVQRRRGIPTIEHVTHAHFRAGPAIQALGAQDGHPDSSPPGYPEEFIDLQLLAPGYRPSVILDVGAGAGHRSLAYAAAFPECTIHALEASPDAFARLAEAIRPYPFVKAHKLGLGAGAGGAAPAAGRDDQPPPGPAQGHDFVRAHGIEDISLLRVAAGARDLAVLEGFAPVLPRVEFVSVEAGLSPHDTALLPLRVLEDFLHRQGFRLFRLYRQVFDRAAGGFPALRSASPLFIRGDLVGQA